MINDQIDLYNARRWTGMLFVLEETGSLNNNNNNNNNNLLFLFTTKRKKAIYHFSFSSFVIVWSLSVTQFSV